MEFYQLIGMSQVVNYSTTEDKNIYSFLKFIPPFEITLMDFHLDHTGRETGSGCS